MQSLIIFSSCAGVLGSQNTEDGMEFPLTLSPPGYWYHFGPVLCDDSKYHIKATGEKKAMRAEYA